MFYPAWLFAFSLFFLAAERLWPRRKQAILRRGIVNDLTYLVVNGEYLGVLVGVLSIHVIAALNRMLEAGGAREKLYLGIMAGKPLWLQWLTLLLVFDFAQWGIHNMLHRIPVLWEFHKVHHSIEELDWIGNWRFHWFEAMFYRMLLYPLAAFFGISGLAMFWYGVASTFVGHFAHANLRIKIGPLKYLVNSPEMHVWHHVHPDAGPPDRNFGITLSLWDWIFGTAYLPEGRFPDRLGFTGIESYPRNVFGQSVAPFLRRTPG